MEKVTLFDALGKELIIKDPTEREVDFDINK